MAELDSIDLEPRHLKKIRSIFARHLPYKKVWAYGSRVKWTASNTSDLDCVVFGATDSEIANAREAFDESDIPFEVQLLNWGTIPDDFKKNIKEGYFILQNKWDWRETTLGDVSEDIAYGYTASAKQDPIGSKFLRITDIANGRLDWKSVPYCEISDIDSIKYQLEPGDVVIARTGATTGATYTMKPRDPSNVVFASYLIRYRVDKSIADPFFIDFCLKSSLWKSYVAGIAGGSAQPGANAKQLASFEISLPLLPEQKAIASVLSGLDDKIDLLHRQNNTLESIAETIFRQWFIEEADDSWFHDELRNYVTVIDNRGKTPLYSEEETCYPLIEVNALGKKNRLVDYALIKKYVNKDIFDHCFRNKLTKYDTILSTVGSIAAISMYVLDLGNIAQNVIGLSAKGISPFYLYQCLKHKIHEILLLDIGGVQPSIKVPHLLSLAIPIPPSNLQRVFENQLIDFVSKMEVNYQQIKTLECLRDMLLPKLISGDIRVEYEEVL